MKQAAQPAAEPPAERAAIEYAGPGRLRSVNLAAQATTVGAGRRVSSSGIGKTPVSGPVAVRAPGPRATGLGSGLVGDTIVSRRHHGGDDQAVYAYAREDLDHFEGLLGRGLADGAFGENLTTVGVDVSGALLGERWRVGADGPLLAVRVPRIPCGTFRAWIGALGWLRTFVEQGLPGAYLAVLEPGEVVAGAPVEVAWRPDHDVRICDLYRAMTTQPQRWPAILAAVPDLCDEAREMGEQGRTYSLG